MFMQAKSYEYMHARICMNMLAREKKERALTKQSWKWRRSNEAPMRCSLETALYTAECMIESALGHVVP